MISDVMKPSQTMSLIDLDHQGQGKRIAYHGDEIRKGQGDMLEVS